MKHLLSPLLGLSLLLSACAPTALAPLPQASSTLSAQAAHTLLVKPLPGRQALNQLAGARVLRTIPKLGWQVVQVSGNPAEAAATLKAAGCVRSAGCHWWRSPAM